MQNRYSGPVQNSSSYLLNTAIVDLPEVKLTVGKLPYVDDAGLRELRRKHNATHVFLRRDGMIANASLVADQQAFGEHYELNLDDDLGFAVALVKEGVIRHLVALGRKLTDFDPISFLADGATNDFLAAAMPPGLTCPPWLSVQAKPEISVRTLRFANKDQVVALSFNLWSRNIIAATCEELLKLGVDLTGAYVTRLNQPDDIRFRPKTELVGRVRSVSNGIIELDDPRDAAVTTVRTSEVYLESRSENLERCLDAVFKDRAVEIKSNLQARITELRSGPGRLSRINAHASYFARTKIEILPGVHVTIGPLLKQGHALFPRLDVMPRPTYIFDPTRQRTHASHDRGLDQHGPYDQATFNAPKPRVAVICQASKKGQVEQFLRKFLDGMPDVKTGRGTAPYEKGFLRKYCTDAWDIEFFQATGNSADAYNKAALQALEQSGTSGRKWNLVLVQIEEHFRDLPAPRNPYLVTKATFLSQGVPSQEFNIETISRYGTQLAYALNQMALATYAKLGGIPWLLQATPGVAHELVFGLGSANVGTDRLGKRERTVGITTVFKGDGDYVLENRSRAVSFDEYPEQVLTMLRSTIGTLKQRYNWQPGESIRLIFHAFKPMKNTEVDAVKTLMSEVAKEFTVEYAFVHVVQDHPFLVFDEKQPGVKDFESRKTKGMMAPTRGRYIQLNRHEGLLCLTGANEVKRPEDGLPSPILLKLHKGSTFVDMTYLARQAFLFSCHSWRTFMPAGMPITVTYSDLIARLLGNLALVPKWNPDTMVGAVGSGRWFL